MFKYVCAVLLVFSLVNVGHTVPWSKSKKQIEAQKAKVIEEENSNKLELEKFCNNNCTVNSINGRKSLQTLENILSGGEKEIKDHVSKIHNKAALLCNKESIYPKEKVSNQFDDETVYDNVPGALDTCQNKCELKFNNKRDFEAYGNYLKTLCDKIFTPEIGKYVKLKVKTPHIVSTTRTKVGTVKKNNAMHDRYQIRNEYSNGNVEFVYEYEVPKSPYKQLQD